MQQAILAGVLGARPLEAGGAPLRLPDLQFADQAGAVALSPENLAPGLDLGALPRPVSLASPAEPLRAPAPSGTASAGYLQFSPPVIDGDRLTLALEVRAAPPGGGPALPISALSLRYLRAGGGWVPAEPPAAMST